MGTPFGTGGQTLPHPPQLRASVAVVTHSLPQRKKPVWQVNPQVPDAQVGTALGGAAQRLPQLPQCAALRWVSTQDPLQFVSAPQLAEHTP